MLCILVCLCVIRVTSKYIIARFYVVVIYYITYLILIITKFKGPIFAWFALKPSEATCCIYWKLLGLQGLNQMFFLFFFIQKPIYVVIIDFNCTLRYVCIAMQIADLLAGSLVHQSRVTARITCE